MHLWLDLLLFKWTDEYKLLNLHSLKDEHFLILNLAFHICISIQQMIIRKYVQSLKHVLWGSVKNC